MTGIFKKLSGIKRKVSDMTSQSEKPNDVDLVLIEPNVEKKNEPSCLRIFSNKFDNKKLREVFEKKLKDEGLIFDETVPNDNIYRIPRCPIPFDRLCKEAEETNLQMPTLVVSDCHHV